MIGDLRRCVCGIYLLDTDPLAVYCTACSLRHTPSERFTSGTVLFAAAELVKRHPNRWQGFTDSDRLFDAERLVREAADLLLGRADWREDIVPAGF